MKYLLFAIFSTHDGVIYEPYDVGVMVPSSETKNLGDYVQALAALRFLPRCDGFIGRDALASYKGKDEVCVIGNSWYRFKDEHHNIHEKIHFLPVSMHADGTDMSQAKGVMSKLRELGNNYDNGIGCRDYHTRDLFERHGIKAYFSSCLTTTINLDIIGEKLKQVISDFGNNYQESDEYKKLKYRLSTIEDNVLNDDYIAFVDFNYTNLKNCDWVMYPDWPFHKYTNFSKMQNALNAVLENYKGCKSVYLSHTISNKLSPVEFLDVAYRSLSIYNKAKLVITSRLHVALPCLAMTTPVVCVHKNFGFRMSAFKEMLNYIEVDNFNKHININDGTLINSNIYKKFADDLVIDCEKFIKRSYQA